MTCSRYLHIGSAHKVIADLNFADIENDEVIIGKEVCSDLNVITVTEHIVIHTERPDKTAFFL